MYKRETNKERKQKEKQLILVGFGDKQLKDLLELKDTKEELKLLEAPFNFTPRYKPETSCSREEIDAFLDYTEWASLKLLEAIDGK